MEFTNCPFLVIIKAKIDRARHMGFWGFGVLGRGAPGVSRHGAMGFRGAAQGFRGAAPWGFEGRRH